MVLDGGDGTSGNPIDITDHKVISALDVLGFLFDDGSEVSLGEFLLSHGGELVESHFVGSVLVGVVGVDVGKIFEEDSLSVSILDFGGEGDAVFGLPALELGDGGGALVVEEHSGGANDSKDHC